MAEFERLEGLEEKFNSSLTRSDAALLLENKKLNRYSDVLAKDHSRVKLRYVACFGSAGCTVGYSCSVLSGRPSCASRGEGREYINANYIDGYLGQERVYIAAQGPLRETIDDFWSMIWQESSSIIIMVSKYANSVAPVVACNVRQLLTCSAITAG